MDLYSVKLRITSVLVGILIALIAAGLLLLVARYLLGVTALFGTLIFVLGFIVALDIMQWLLGPYIIGRAFRVRKVEANDTQMYWLNDIVKKVASENRVSTPTLYVSEIPLPNAFAYSSPIAGKRIAVTKGALDILNKDELEAVIGHEIGHLRHRDVELLMAIGLIPTLLFYLGYMLFFSGAMGNRNGGALVLGAVVLIVISFVFNIMILGINRMRESYADINAARTIENGASNLQTALAKIVISSRRPSSSRGRGKQRPTDSNFFSSMLLFSNYSQESALNASELVEKWKTARVSRFAGIFSDHPLPAKRIQMLERYKNQF